MIKILKETKKKIFFISPQEIKYCISPSIFCDYTQFGSTKIHPHAGIDRGVFREDIDGYIRLNSSKWDTKGVQFTKLLEYQAIFNHYTGKQNGKSKFAKECSILKENIMESNYLKISENLFHKEKRTDSLINSIIKKGVYPLEKIIMMLISIIFLLA